MSGTRSKIKVNNHEGKSSKPSEGSSTKRLSQDCWLGVCENLSKESQVLLGSVDCEFDKLVTPMKFNRIKAEDVYRAPTKDLESLKALLEKARHRDAPRTSYVRNLKYTQLDPISSESQMSGLSISKEEFWEEHEKTLHEVLEKCNQLRKIDFYEGAGTAIDWPKIVVNWPQLTSFIYSTVNAL